MAEIENQIREAAKKLFNEKKIDLFIGYQKGTIPASATPVFISKEDEIEKLSWNSFCSNNLAVYLPRYFIPDPREKDEQKFPKIGIVAKGCDSRSIIGLIKEHQIPRDNLVVVGIGCDGMIDKNKIKNSIEILEIQESDGKVIATLNNNKKNEFKKEELLADCCLNCQYTSPLIHDVSIGSEKSEEKSIAKDSKIEDFEKLPLEERWKYFEKEMSKCIRCYACRSACPNCYCSECFAEQTKPQWLGISDNISDIMLYHIGRIFHQAGRCVDCGACVKACPMGIDLRIFTYKLVKDVAELFDFSAGTSIKESPPLSTFKEEDKQDFILEP